MTESPAADNRESAVAAVAGRLLVDGNLVRGAVLVERGRIVDVRLGDVEIADGAAEELGRERTMLEKKIEELRAFERNYRARLKSYIEDQLKDLDATGFEPQQAETEGGDEPRLQTHELSFGRRILSAYVNRCRSGIP